MRLLALFAAVVVLASGVRAAEKPTASQLIEMARKRASAADFPVALLAAMGPEALKKGTGVLGDGPDFIWAVETEKRPALFVDEEAQPPMKRTAGGKLWYQTAKLKTGRAHSFHYTIEGARFGGRTDFPAFGPDSYARPGVPQGRISEKLVHTSRIYADMKSDYWIYVPAQYDPQVPAALMVWQDGAGFVERDGGSRLLNVVDNLIHQKKMPVTILVLIAPGMVGETRMRSIEYDRMDDTYARFLREEILAEVQSRYNIRKDGYSRAIGGQSSGGICSFNVAWHQPDQFSRVLSRIGSYTSIQWNPSQGREGGHAYPFKVRKEPKRNIRIWMDDGMNDLENDHGSWPLQNVQMANSLKMKNYDFHFSIGNGTHSTAHGNAELPEALTWLWRDYDASLTGQEYVQEESERTRPLFRVKIANRD